MIFSIFRFFCTLIPDLQILSKPYINGNIIYSSFRLCINHKERERDEAEVSVMLVFTGGWALNRKELKLIQTIGKGEFGGA